MEVQGDSILLWVDRHRACSHNGDLVRWPDGGSYEEQTNLVVEMMYLIKSVAQSLET